VAQIGMPEAQIILTQAATYVACAPKSNACVNAIFAAMDSVKSVRTTVPPHLQDAHYKGASDLDRGVGYKYVHLYPNHYVKQQYLPSEIADERFYKLGDEGYEAEIKRRFKDIGADKD
jgi:putative ATPase